MFCGKCGTQNADDATVCVNCGAKLKDEPKKTIKLDNKKIGIIAVAVVAVVLGILLFSGRSYKTVAIEYTKAIFNESAEDIFDLAPEKLIDYVKTKLGEEEFEDEIAELNIDLDTYKILNEYYFIDDISKNTYKVIGTEDVSNDELESIKEIYKEVGVDVKNAKDVEVEVSFVRSEEKQTDTFYIRTIKVGKNWYLEISEVNF